MAGNGTTNYNFVSGNALSSTIPTATNSGIITNGMQSKSVGGKKRKSRKHKKTTRKTKKWFNFF